ncbi:MAG: response regulator [Vallitaleaceae bacterium]|jgi:two-component system chemotaxis response regulator CheY|nr:response regulator [Vallitaleaceae bacterium]
MKRVLIVDDAAFMRTSIRKMLEPHEYSIVGEAENGEQAIEQYKKLKPDIVTMDITMPVMNGLEATKAILVEDPNATIVMISALGQETYVKEAIIMGAKNFIVKPFKSETVLKVLSALQ